jgi:hypothetical protein
MIAAAPSSTLLHGFTPARRTMVVSISRDARPAMKPPSVHAVLLGKVKLPAHPRHGELSPDAYAVTVSGSELAPRICDGDTLAVDPAVAPYPGCHVVWPADAGNAAGAQVGGR